jgi:hypothetical protein
MQECLSGYLELLVPGALFTRVQSSIMEGNAVGVAATGVSTSYHEIQRSDIPVAVLVAVVEIPCLASNETLK